MTITTAAATSSCSLMQIQQTANYATATRLTAYWQNATNCSVHSKITADHFSHLNSKSKGKKPGK